MGGSGGFRVGEGDGALTWEREDVLEGVWGGMTEGGPIEGGKEGERERREGAEAFASV